MILAATRARYKWQVVCIYRGPLDTQTLKIQALDLIPSAMLHLKQKIQIYMIVTLI